MSLKCKKKIGPIIWSFLKYSKIRAFSQQYQLENGTNEDV